MRDAPSIPIVEAMLAKGATVAAYDPEAMEEAKKIFGARIKFARTTTAAWKAPTPCWS